MFFATSEAEYARYVRACAESMERMSSAHAKEAYNEVLRSYPVQTEYRDLYAEEVKWRAYLRTKNALIDNPNIQKIVIEERFNHRRAIFLTHHFKSL